MSAEVDPDAAAGPVGVTIGVTGQQARWSVSPWGSVVEWGASSPVLDWFVAADDRWHVPADEPTVRQLRIDGTPVVETRIRIPDGDAVQRVWAVPELGGAVVVEVENESPLPFAVAFAGSPVLTERPTSDVPVEGISLPADATVLPVGHRSTVRVVMPSAAATANPPAGGLARLSDAAAVVRGWTTLADRASRLQVPDETLALEVTAARCDLLLEGPVGQDDDPVGFLLDVGELVRCGDDASPWLPEIIDPVETAARAASESAGGDAGRPVDTAVLDALTAALMVATVAGDDRASGDLRRMLTDLGAPTEESSGARRVRRRFGRRRGAPAVSTAAGSRPESFAELRRGASVGRFVRAVERVLADATGSPGGAMAARVALLPVGLPTAWLGTDFEVHALPAGPGSSVSFALRWHGERPAVLWESAGDPIELSSPVLAADWLSAEPSGEALWDAPPMPRAIRTSVSVEVGEAGSFS